MTHYQRQQSVQGWACHIRFLNQNASKIRKNLWDKTTPFAIQCERGTMYFWVFLFSFLNTEETSFGMKWTL